MPFTISHAAAVLPLRSVTRLPLAALMIGSMSPDFAYFLPGDLDRLETHSFAGLFWFCWPIGIAAWLAFVHFLEAPTLALAPPRWHDRFARSDRVINPATLAFASLAVILGAITHDTWDSVTHWNTAVTSRFPIFYAKVIEFPHGHLRLFVLLQHLSSLVGLAVLAAWLLRRPPVPQPIFPALPAVSTFDRVLGVVFLALGSALFALRAAYVHSNTFFERRLFYMAIAGMTGALVAWIVVALAIRIRNLR